MTTRNHPNRVLVVCLGNICRSPMGQGALERRVAEAGLEIEIDSAGLGSWHIGNPPNPRGIKVSNARGYDNSHQRARLIRDQDFHDFDLILAMDSENFAALSEMAPQGATARILRLGDLICPGQSYDIADPYDFGVAEFEQCFFEISVACAEIEKRIRFYA